MLWDSMWDSMCTLVHNKWNNNGCVREREKTVEKTSTITSGIIIMVDNKWNNKWNNNNGGWLNSMYSEREKTRIIMDGCVCVCV